MEASGKAHCVCWMSGSMDGKRAKGRLKHRTAIIWPLLCSSSHLFSKRARFCASTSMPNIFLSSPHQNIYADRNENKRKFCVFLTNTCKGLFFGIVDVLVNCFWGVCVYAIRSGGNFWAFFVQKIALDQEIFARFELIEIMITNFV